MPCLSDGIKRMGFSPLTDQMKIMDTRGTQIQLATRGSDLALWQANTVKDRLEQRRISVELVEVETTGDTIRDELIHRLGTTGAFVRSLDERVLAGDLDGSVHSMKDMPTEQPEELVVAGLPRRGPPGDVLVTPAGTALSDLPEGATVGTASLRRQAQLRATRPDLQIEGLRGNVDTRIEKLLAPSLKREAARRREASESDSAERDTNSGGDSADEYEQWVNSLPAVKRRALNRDVDIEYDAICLAEAGLSRSGLLDHVETQSLPPRSFVPAPAQGAIAVTALDGETAELIHDILDHPPTRVEVTVERTILGELGGGCVAPIGVYARLQGAVVTTTVRVLDQTGTEEVVATRELPVERHAEAATEFAVDLADKGAADLIEEAKREQPDGPKRD